MPEPLEIFATCIDLKYAVEGFPLDRMIKIIFKKKKYKKAKWLSEEALQIAEKKKKEVKGKGAKEMYTHLNAECQRIARRDEKDFLSDQ